jgi:hypothetical protein
MEVAKQNIFRRPIGHNSENPISFRIPLEKETGKTIIIAVIHYIY